MEVCFRTPKDESADARASRSWRWPTHGTSIISGWLAEKAGDFQPGPLIRERGPA